MISHPTPVFQLLDIKQHDLFHVETARSYLLTGGTNRAPDRVADALINSFGLPVNRIHHIECLKSHIGASEKIESLLDRLSSTANHQQNAHEVIVLEYLYQCAWAPKKSVLRRLMFNYKKLNLSVILLCQNSFMLSKDLRNHIECVFIFPKVFVNDMKKFHKDFVGFLPWLDFKNLSNQAYSAGYTALVIDYTISLMNISNRISTYCLNPSASIRESSDMTGGSKAININDLD